MTLPSAEPHQEAQNLETLARERRRVIRQNEAQLIDIANLKAELIAAHEQARAALAAMDAMDMRYLIAQRDAKMMLDALYASRSWRITRPLRRLARLARALIRRWGRKRRPGSFF